MDETKRAVRPIDAHALLDKMQYRLPVEDDISDAVSTCAKIARRLVEKAPTLELVPVKHGRWEPHPRHHGFDRCSSCQDCIIANDWGDGDKWHYCPNCGARMDGDGDG